jgi:hypothetical protein
LRKNETKKIKEQRKRHREKKAALKAETEEDTLEPETERADAERSDSNNITDDSDKGSFEVQAKEDTYNKDGGGEFRCLSIIIFALNIKCYHSLAVLVEKCFKPFSF